MEVNPHKDTLFIFMEEFKWIPMTFSKIDIERKKYTENNRGVSG